MTNSCPSLARVLLEVRTELQSRFSVSQVGLTTSSSANDVSATDQKSPEEPCPSRKEKPSTPCSSSKRVDWGDSPRIVLDELTDEDWKAIMYPVSDLKPYLTAVTPQGDEGSSGQQGNLYNLCTLDHYVTCRCAELPMRLQTEALILRRHEESRQRHMKKLIQLSQCMVYCAPRAMEPEQGPNAVHEAATTELEQRFHRCELRIRELEQKIAQECKAKRKCSQRMVLMSALVYALIDRLDEQQDEEMKRNRERRI